MWSTGQSGCLDTPSPHPHAAQKQLCCKDKMVLALLLITDYADCGMFTGYLVCCLSSSLLRCASSSPQATHQLNPLCSPWNAQPAGDGNGGGYSSQGLEVPAGLLFAACGLRGLGAVRLGPKPCIEPAVRASVSIGVCPLPGPHAAGVLVAAGCCTSS